MYPERFAKQRGVRHRVLPVAEPSDRLGEGQRGAPGIGEVGRIAPGRHGEEALVRFACLPEDARVHVDADAAAVDLARSHLHEADRP